jgi:hypothetical protein
MSGSGIGGAGESRKLWTIFDLDRDEDIVGQFVAQNVTKTVSANIAPSGSSGWRRWSSGRTT